MTVRVGIGPPPEFTRFSLEQKRAFLGSVADAGVSHVFVADHVSFHGGSGMDGLVQAAGLAMLHPTLSVHVGVFLLALRHPVPVAREVATISEWAPGRLLLGVGVGGEDRHEFEVCGVDPSTRGRRTDESLVILRRLLGGEKVSHNGEFFSVSEAAILPVPDPAVRIVIGGRSSAAVHRAAQFGDGWLAVWVSVRRMAAEIEKLGPGIHGLQVWAGVDADPALARRRLAHAMQSFYRVPFESFAPYSPAGTARDVAAALRPYVDAGVSTFNVQIITSDPQAVVDAAAVLAQELSA